MTTRSWLLILLAAALCLRALAVPIGVRMAERRGMKYFDEYGGIAKNILEGRGFSYA